MTKFLSLVIKSIYPLPPLRREKVVFLHTSTPRTEMLLFFKGILMNIICPICFHENKETEVQRGVEGTEV